MIRKTPRKPIRVFLQAGSNDLDCDWGNWSLANLEMAAALVSGLKQVAELRDSVIKAAEQQIVQLAIDVARKVLMQEIQAGRYEIDPIVQAALAQVTSWQEVVVHLNPEDFARCRQAQENSQDDSSGARFVADPAVRRSECVLETAQGVVRSATEEHLREIASALQEPE